MYQWNSVHLYKINTAFLYLKIYWWLFFFEKDISEYFIKKKMKLDIYWLQFFFFLQNAFIVELYRGELMVGFKSQTIWRRQQTPFIS